MSACVRSISTTADGGGGRPLMLSLRKTTRSGKKLGAGSSAARSAAKLEQSQSHVAIACALATKPFFDDSRV